MAAKKTTADKFRERLDGLSRSIPEDLRLPSLEQNRLEGYAYLFRLVLPLLVGLKPILKTAGHIEQQEFLISRIECRSM